MKSSRGAAAIAVSALVIAALSGCIAEQSGPIADSQVTVSESSPFYSLNDATTFGNTPANADIVYATNSSFNYYDDTPQLVRDESFGTYVKVSDDPLVVKYTIADGVRWSDGTAVDAADLLLNWAALSGAFNTKDFDKTEFIDPATGAFTSNLPSKVVFFDSGADRANPRGLGLVSDVPEISVDMKSITMTYDSPYADWELAFRSAGRPAHVVAGLALGIDDPHEAKIAVVDAITDGDTAQLRRLARAWNTAFNLDSMPDDAARLVGNGPYEVTGFVAGQYVELTASPDYAGERAPIVERVVVRVIPNPLAAVQALHDGTVQVITPQATSDVADVLGLLDVTIASGSTSAFERIDLQFDQSRSGLFADPRIREAFLKTVPRQQIVDELVVPVQEDAAVRNSEVFVPGAPGYSDSAAGNGSGGYADVDIAGATALLAEAGIPAPEVCILFDPADPRRVAEFSLIQQSAAQAGISVMDCSNADWQQVLGTPGAYDAVLTAAPQANLGLGFVGARFGTDGVDNHTFYSSPDMDALVDDLGEAADADDQVAIAQKIDRLLWTDHYGMPLFQVPTFIAYDQRRVAGVLPSPLAPSVFWNIWQWTTAVPDQPTPAPSL